MKNDEIDPKDAGRAGRQLLNRWIEIARSSAASDLAPGAALVKFYFSKGGGDRRDLRSTVVDMIANLGHATGEGFAECCERSKAIEAGAWFDVDKVTSAPPDAVAHCLADLAAYCAEKEFDYEAAVRIALQHVGVEAAAHRPSPGM